jgi:hypothetical protein
VKKRLLHNSLLYSSLLFLTILTISMLYYLPSNVARVLFILAFSALVLVTVGLTAGKQISFGSLLLVLVTVASIVFFLADTVKLQPYIEGVTLSETRSLALSYQENGALVSSTPHSYFFQIPMLIYFISITLGISTVYSGLIVIFAFIVLNGLVGLYIFKVVRAAMPEKTSPQIPALLAFFVVSTALMTVEVGYRLLASLLFLLLLCYLFSNGLKGRKDVVVTLLLVVGITLGSPTAALLLIPFFVLFAAFKRQPTTVVYALIPLAYMIYSGYSYTTMLRSYGTFAWQGFLDFFRQITVSQFPERVLPWGRVTLPTAADTYVISAAYLSTIAVSVLAVLIFTFSRANTRNVVTGDDRGPLLLADSACLWLTLAIAAVTYIGASASPEVPFSDIRTIVISFILVLLPFIFTSSKLLSRINVKKALLTLVIMLFVLSSLMTMYEAYPKSNNDPINVMEDQRVDTRSQYYVGVFLNGFVGQANVVFDYKTNFATLGYQMIGNYTTAMLSDSTLPSSNVIVFDANGLKFRSLYISPDLYAEVYNLTLSENVVYTSGNITVVRRK